MKNLIKFIKKREQKFAKEIGGTRRPASGALWFKKEDVIDNKKLYQIKTTTKKTATVRLTDLQKLEEHAIIEHKIPIYVIDFILDRFESEQYYVIRRKDINELP